MNQTQAQAQAQAVTIDQVLTFKLNDSLFCIPVDLVESVIEMPEIIDLPQSPAYIAGSFLYRRQTLLAIHMRALLGLPDTNQPRRPTMVVTNLDDQKVGLWIDEIKGLVDTGRCTISELPALAANQGVRQALLFNDQVIYPINVSAMSRLRTELDRIEAQRLEDAARAKAAAEAEAQAEAETEAELAESSEALLAEPGLEPEVGLTVVEEAGTEEVVSDESTAEAAPAPAEALLESDASEAEVITSEAENITSEAEVITSEAEIITSEAEAISNEAGSVEQQDNVVALTGAGADEAVVSEPASEPEAQSPEIDDTATSDETIALESIETSQTEDEQAWWEQAYDAGSTELEAEPEEEALTDETADELAETSPLDESGLLQTSTELDLEVEPELEHEELELVEETLDAEAEAEIDRLLEELVAEVDPELYVVDEFLSPARDTDEPESEHEQAALALSESANDPSPDLGELAAMMAALTKNKTTDTETAELVDADALIDEALHDAPEIDDAGSVESLAEEQTQIDEEPVDEVTTALTDIEVADIGQDELQSEETEESVEAYLAIPKVNDDAALLELVEEELDASAEQEVDRLLDDLVTEEQEQAVHTADSVETEVEEETDEDSWTSIDDSANSEITADTLEASLAGSAEQDESAAADLDEPNSTVALSQDDSSDAPHDPKFVTGHFPDPYAGQTAFGELSYPVDDYSDELSSSQQGLYEPVSVAEHSSAANDYAESVDEAGLSDGSESAASKIVANESVILEQVEESPEEITTEEVTTASDSDEVRANLPALIESNASESNPSESNSSGESAYDNSQPPPELDRESMALAEVIQFRARQKEETVTEEADTSKPEPYVDVRTIITQAPGRRERHIVRNIMLGMLAIMIGGVVVWRQIDWTMKQKIIKQLPTEMQTTVSGVISYKMTINRPVEGPDRLVVDLKDYEIRVIHADKVDPTLLKQRQSQNAKIYKVKKGDTLWKIAERHLQDSLSYPELAKNSDINKPDLIYPGDIVTIHRKIPD